VFAVTYRAATVRERSGCTLFRSLLEGDSVKSGALPEDLRPATFDEEETADLRRHVPAAGNSFDPGVCPDGHLSPEAAHNRPHFRLRDLKWT